MTMGPAPMMRMVEISVRFGMFVRIWLAGEPPPAERTKKGRAIGLEWPERVLRKPCKGVQAGAPARKSRLSSRKAGPWEPPGFSSWAAAGEKAFAMPAVSEDRSRRDGLHTVSRAAWMRPLLHGDLDPAHDDRRSRSKPGRRDCHRSRRRRVHVGTAQRRDSDVVDHASKAVARALCLES